LVYEYDQKSILTLLEGGEEGGDAAGPTSAGRARGQVRYRLGRRHPRPPPLVQVAAVAAAMMKEAQCVHLLERPTMVAAAMASAAAAAAAGQRGQHVRVMVGRLREVVMVAA